MEKKRIAVFDFNAADCAETAAAVLACYKTRAQPVDLAEFTEYSPFVYSFKNNRDAGIPYHMTFIGVDTMMGVEVARHIRSLDKWCPIFLFSRESDFAMEGFRLHVLDYFSKPATAAKIESATLRIGVRCLSGFQDPKLFEPEDG